MTKARLARLGLVAVVALSSPAAAAVAAAPERVTLQAHPVVLARDRLLSLNGAISSPRAKEIVTLEARDCGQRSFRVVARVSTVAGGGFAWEYFTPGITATLRASWRGATSAAVRVRDRVFVELGPGAAAGEFLVSVRAKMPFGGKRVELQRLRSGQAGGWETVGAARLASSGAPPGSTFVFSTARLRADVSRGTVLRAVVPRSQTRPCYLAGYSNLLRR